jgi:hypothetical protein
MMGLASLLNIGPVYLRGDWPYGLERMVEIGQVKAKDIELYGLGRFIDSEYVWQIKVSSHGLDTIADELGLATVPPSSVPSEFWQAFPTRWGPEPRQASQYFSTPSFPATSRGEDGDHLFAAYDPRTEILYVWCKSNF